MKKCVKLVITKNFPKSVSKLTRHTVQYSIIWHTVYLFLTWITITKKQHVEFYLQIVVFCSVTPCSFVDVYRYIRRTSSLHWRQQALLKSGEISVGYRVLHLWKQKTLLLPRWDTKIRSVRFCVLYSRPILKIQNCKVNTLHCVSASILRLQSSPLEVNYLHYRIRSEWLTGYNLV
jgi:hypothetical protein